MINRACYLFFMWMLLLLGPVAQAQLKLGSNPATINKSSVLELESDVQGLLLPRIPDTSAATLTTAPNGMIIFFTPDNSLMVRKNGFWRRVIDSASLSFNGWALGGNAVLSAQNFGTTTNFDLPLITNNLERMRVTNAGNVGIGTTAPSTQLHIKTGTANDGGLRLENLTSASAITNGAGYLGVDGNGKVVRTNTQPVIYSGGAGGGTATADAVTKVWIADVQNTGSGIVTINFPANVVFTNILNIQVTAKATVSVDATTSPIATLFSNTLTSVTVRVLESAGILLGGQALEAHTLTSTRIYIRVEGN